MTLAELIQSIDGWETKTNTELLAAVQAITVTTTDSQLYTYAGVIDKLGMQAGFGFRATVRGLADLSNPAGLGTEAFEAINFAHSRFEVGGLDLSRPDVQAMLDSFVAITPLAPFIPGVKSIGVLVQHPYASTTLQQVDDAKALLQLAATKSELVQAAANRYNAFITAVDSWDGSGSQPVL